MLLMIQIFHYQNNLISHNISLENKESPLAKLAVTLPLLLITVG